MACRRLSRRSSRLQNRSQLRRKRDSRGKERSMTGQQRIRAMIQGQPVDHLPLMPITMMFAADHAQVHYRDYVTDFRILAAAQLAVSEKYDFDYVSVISDP